MFYSSVINKIYDNPAILNTIKIFSIIILFAAFILSYLSFSLWDYDFWWHIATGGYIVSTGSLPDKDPFSYTSSLEENRNPFPEWENFILKQYWFSQIIFYLIYDNTGPAGIIILRALLLTMTLIMVIWRLQRWHVSFPVSFIFIFILFSTTLITTGERPVLITILFTAVVLFLLEDFKDSKTRRIFLLAPLMLLWSNMHGGFVIGAGIIIVYMLGEGINIFLKRSAHTKKEMFLFYGAAALAIVASFVNPTGWDALFIAINIPFKYQAIHQGVQEYISPYDFYRYKMYPLLFEYIFLALLFPIVLVLRNKKMDLTHIMLLSVFAIASISASRFIIYYVIAGTMILGREADILITSLLRKKLSAVNYKKIIIGLTIASLFSAGFYFAGNIVRYKYPSFKIASSYSIPVEAVNFIDKNKLSGNMLNDYAYGGYIAWRLYPYYKTFVDTRALNISVRLEYEWISNAVEKIDPIDNVTSAPAKPLWELLLNHYNINYVILSLIDRISQVPPLVFKLTESDNWVLVYSDHMSVIFVKNTDQNKDIIRKNPIPKERIYNMIIYLSAGHALDNKINPRSLISVGETFYKMGRLEDSLKAYKYALDRMPGDAAIKERIRQIESELKYNFTGKN